MLLVCLYFFCRFGLPPPLSLPFSGRGPLRPVCIHAEPSPSGPSTSASSQSTTQLASMSDPHTPFPVVILPTLTPRPGICEVYLAGLRTGVSHRLLSQHCPVAIILNKPPIIGSQPFYHLCVCHARSLSRSDGGTACSTTQTTSPLQPYRLNPQGT